jgi:hypothetical protein
MPRRPALREHGTAARDKARAGDIAAAWLASQHHRAVGRRAAALRRVLLQLDGHRLRQGSVGDRARAPAVACGLG